MTELLLEATGIAKHYGAVAALRSGSLAVRPGEVHALMGANGAGKSTLVKVLTGAIHPDAGTIAVRGQPYSAQSPAEARRGGIVSVYQEPSLIPDLDIRSNLRLTGTPVEPFRHWLTELGIADLDLTDLARELPLATLRVIDLARALAIEPHVLLLDEMTAALPADLTERVLEVISGQRGSDRCIIFISHRLIEIAAVCDRATVLREGETVGVVDVTEGSEDRIVELMLGTVEVPVMADRTAAAERDRTRPRASPCASSRRAPGSRTSPSTSIPARCSGWWPSRGRDRTSSSTSWPGPTVPPAARSRSTASPSRSGTRPTRSAPGWCTCRPTVPRRSSCSAPSARTSRCRSRRRSARGGRSASPTRGAGSPRRPRSSRSTRAPRPRSAACRAGTSRR